MFLVETLDPRSRPRVALVAGLLAISLACVGVLALQAYRAQRAHRAIMERALVETVEFAAWSHAGAARRALATHLFDHGFERMEEIGVPRSPAGLSELNAGRGPLHFGEIAHWFRRDLVDGSTDVTGDPQEGILRFIEDSLSTAPYDSRWAQGSAILKGGKSLLAWRLHPKTAASPTVLYGFAVPTTAVERLLAEAHEEIDLLPPGRVGERLARELFRVEIRAPDGSTVFTAGAPLAEAERVVTASDTLGAGFGGLVLRLVADPRAEFLLPGADSAGPGWPLYAGLFALVAGLTLSAVLLVQRESQLARARADFVSGVTHAFRTPLAQIRLYGETLALGRDRKPADRERALGVILREADRLDRMVEDVLAFMRSPVPGAAPPRARTDIASIAAETAEALRGVAESRGARLRTEGDEPAIAIVDPTAIRRALANLIDNALKYGPLGQTVTIRVERWNGRVRIAVEDEGPGIPVAGRGRIWRPFERLAVHNAAGGSGIGLAVVRRVALDHGGSARVEDRETGGARFILSLPAVDARPDMSEP